ncbi:type II toxin-antitoxin system VapC family toxin [Humibacter antri]
MIYLDTSAAVKALLEERATEAVQELFAHDAKLTSSRLLAVELHAVADRRKLKPANVGELLERVSLLPLDDETLDSAVQLHSGLRTLGALHLATAHGIAKTITGVLSFDRELTGAARSLGLPIHPLSEG